MPDWCRNKLTIKRSAEAVRAFYDQNAKFVEWTHPFDAASDSPAANARTTSMAVRHLDFEQSAPFPADWTEEQTHGRISLHDTSSSWVDWCPVHWGTKWNARDVKVTVSACGTVLTYTFSTAWDPPEAWAKKAWERAIAQSTASLHMELKYTLEGEDGEMITALTLTR